MNYHLVGLRGMDAVDVEENDPHSGSVEFEAFLLGSVAEIGYALDSDGEVVMNGDTLHGTLIRAGFSASVKDNIATFTANDTANLQSPLRQFDAGEDAWEWLMESIGSLSGVEVVGDGEAKAEGELVVKGANGRVATVERWGDSDEWEVVFGLDDDEEIRIQCDNDPSARVWAGKEAFDAWPPFQLFGRGRLEPGPVPRHLIAVAAPGGAGARGEFAVGTAGGRCAACPTRSGCLFSFA